MPSYRHWSDLPSSMVVYKSKKGWNITLSVRKKTFKVVNRKDKFEAFSDISRQVGNWHHNCSNLLNDKYKKFSQKLEDIRQHLNDEK